MEMGGIILVVQRFLVGQFRFSRKVEQGLLQGLVIYKSAVGTVAGIKAMLRPMGGMLSFIRTLLGHPLSQKGKLYKYLDCMQLFTPSLVSSVSIEFSTSRTSLMFMPL